MREYTNLDFGTKSTTTKMDIVYVDVKPEMMIQDYAEAIIREAKRMNPLKFESVANVLTTKALTDYCTAIIQIRIQSISGEAKDWRKAKRLVIPDFLQFIISQVGIVTDRDRGLKFVPVMEQFNFDIDELMIVSDALAAFASDGLYSNVDAFPRSEEGDKDTMNLVIINDFVMGQTPVHLPICSYVSAFLGLKLKEQQTYQMLYRVRYDDIDFIRDCLRFERSIIC